MKSPYLPSSSPAVTDVYTNLNGLQNLKNEKDSDVALKKISQQFESMFINMLLKNMRAANAVFSEGNMFDSQESKFYRDMHDNQLALSLAHGRGFGIAEAMFRQLSSSKDKPIDTKSKLNIKGLDDTDGLIALPIKEAIENRVEKQKSVDQQTLINHTPSLQWADRKEIAQSPSDFIERVKQGAERAAKALGIEKEILIAQAALETGWGQHVFAKGNGESTFNLFNIKADSRWKGDAIDKPTLEYLGGKLANISSRFRSYSSIQDSFKDYSDFILGNERYSQAVTESKDAVDYIKNIHRAGYATDPNYSSKVESVYTRVKTLIAQGIRAGVGDE